MALANFIRQGSTASSVTYNFSVGGTATFNTDYTVTFPPGVTGTWTATSGSVVIPSGSSQVDVTVSPIGDSVLEGDETIVVTLTSTSPAMPISSANSAAALVIKNDDFSVQIKWLAVGSLNGGTTLTGNLQQSSSFIGANQGVAPTNWTSWFVSPVNNASSPRLGWESTTTSIDPKLYKAVLRTPNFASVDTTTEYIQFTLWFTGTLSFVGDGAGAWRLKWSANGFLSTPFDVSVWLDMIVEGTLASTTLHINGLTSTTAPVGTPNDFQFNSEVYLRGAVGVAALSLTSGQGYSPSLFPITPSNL